MSILLLFPFLKVFGNTKYCLWVHLNKKVKKKRKKGLEPSTLTLARLYSTIELFSLYKK